MSDLIENLLYQSEGTALDFKKEQYFFSKATDEQKSELLKDILAFSNAWRQGEAYIVIGVEEVVGGRHNPFGTEDHFDDSRLQQFVNSKTNRKVEFAYEVHNYEGMKIGIIRISKQQRPIYAVKNYGKVKKEVVYYRSGSSTATANPDDIARMGRDSISKTQIPLMNLKFANLEIRDVFGTDVEVSLLSYERPKFGLSDFKIPNQSQFDIYSNFNRANPSYWRDKEKYIRLANLLKPIGFVVENTSSTLANNVRIEITNNFDHAVKILDELPHKPSSDFHANMMHNIRPINQPKSPISISHHGNDWTLEISFGNVQPKSTVWLSEPFFLGSTEQKKFDITAFIYADNLPEPQQISLSVNFEVENRQTLTIEDLKSMYPLDK